MSANILLVATSFEEVSLITSSRQKEDGVKFTDDTHYPLGIAYLHAYIEARGDTVNSLFLNNHDFDSCLASIIESIQKDKPDIVGLQVLTPNRVSSYRIIEYLHERYPQIKLIVGGMHISTMYTQMVEKYPYLVAVRGEAEQTIGELIDALSSDEADLAAIDGIAFMKDGEVVVTKPRDLVGNLDYLPFPKHELFFTPNRVSGCILTERGCPFKCSFCVLDSMSRRKVRYRSIDNVVDEIEHMIASFPNMKTIWLHDDTFFVNNKRVIEFCDEVMRRKIKMQFICSGRVKPISKMMVRKLEQAGFVKVLFGMESGNDQILKASLKGITCADVVNAFNLFADTKIELYAFLIVGLPGETKETILETARFVQKLQRIKYVHYREDIAILTLYPGTQVYDIAKDKGLIDDSYWLSDKPSPLFIVENTQEELMQFKDTLLNYVCIDRFWTLAGFRAQFRMIPCILRYKWQKLDFVQTIGRWTERTMPGFVCHALRGAYRLVRQDRVGADEEAQPVEARLTDEPVVTSCADNRTVELTVIGTRSRAA